jgi:hypothetical protein
MLNRNVSMCTRKKFFSLIMSLCLPIGKQRLSLATTAGAVAAFTTFFFAAIVGDNR